MRNVFRFALEGEQEQQLISVKGPLGEAMTKALNVEYAKKDPVTGEPTPDGAALESQAQDVTVMQSLVDAVQGSDDDAAISKGIEVYGVSEQDVTPETVVDVVNDMDNAGDKEYVVIADASTAEATDGSGEVEEQLVDISNASAMEALRTVVKMKGGRFYSSLEEFVEDIIEPSNGDVPVVPENPSGNTLTPETGGGDGSGENAGGDGTGNPPEARTNGNEEADQPGASVAATE